MSRKEIMLYRYFLLNRKIQLWLKKDELNHFVLVTFKEILEKDSWLLGGLLVGVRLVFDNLVTSLVFPATRHSWIDLSLRKPLKGQAGLQMMDGWKKIQQSTTLLQKVTVLNWKKTLHSNSTETR